jgi:hypothetical protein
MAEFLTFLIAFPVIYGIGLFYHRLGCWTILAVREIAAAVAANSEARPSHRAAEAMPDESRYEAALATAQAIIRQLTTRPDLPRHERLACVTFSILQAMHYLDERRPGRSMVPVSQHSNDNDRETVGREMALRL